MIVYVTNNKEPWHNDGWKTESEFWLQAQYEEEVSFITEHLNSYVTV